jgi:tetratricopeptide (TPR) repeat protein
MKSFREHALICLALLLLALGCGAKPDPYGQQVQKADAYAQKGEDWLSQGDFKKAERDFTKGLNLSRSVDYRRGVAAQLNNLGAVALEQGDLPKAREHFTQAFEINRETANWTDAATNQANLATVAQKAKDPAGAARHLALAEDAARRAENKAALGQVYCRLAGFSLDQGDQSRARHYLEQAQSLAVAELKGLLHYQWGRLLFASGNAAQALEHLRQALAADKDNLDRAAMAADLMLLGEVHQSRGEWDLAFSAFERAFDVYAGLGKKGVAEACRRRLAAVNTQGGLGRSMDRFDNHPLLTPAKKTSSPQS